MENVIILGSSNSNGNTRKISDFIKRSGHWDFIDLNEYEINHFDYNHKNEGDDFVPLFKMIVKKYDTILFATPIYWYSMSGVMKVFFDRISDILKKHKALGRSLNGKKMAALSCSEGENTNPYFFYPFKATAEYLDMKYMGDLHVALTDQNLTLTLMNRIDNFVRTLDISHNE